MRGNGSVLDKSVDDNIKRLEVLNTSLTELEQQTTAREGSTALYDTGSKQVVGYGLHHERCVAVQRCFHPAGVVFPEHKHDGVEHLIVYKGRVIVHIEDERITLKKGDGFMVPADTPHSISSPVDSWLVGVTIPAEEGYPDAAIGYYE